MSGDDVDTRAATMRLVVHAAAMGGWLTASGVSGQREWAVLMPDLVRGGLFEFRPAEPGVHVARFELTDAGRAVAVKLATAARDR